MRNAIIIGSGGQDGRLLSRQLERESIRVIGISRAAVTIHGAPAPFVDIADPEAVSNLVETTQPEAVYYVAGHHQSAENRFEERIRTITESRRVHVDGAVNFLEAIATTSLQSRMVYAASSLLFASSPEQAIVETTPFFPESAYAITKRAGADLCVLYRRKHGVKVSVAYLFNHESPLRRADFVTQKIIRTARSIRDGGAERLILGDLSAKIDWGWAPDYADAMIRMARHPDPDDFVVATGELHSVRELVERVFTLAGLDWTKHVDERRVELAERNTVRLGDSSRLRAATGWKPTVTFEKMVERLWSGYGAPND